MAFVVGICSLEVVPKRPKIHLAGIGIQRPVSNRGQTTPRRAWHDPARAEKSKCRPLGRQRVL